jgi:hypothetical protein
MIGSRLSRTFRVAIGLLGVLLSSTPAHSQTHGEGFVGLGVGAYSNPFTSGRIIDLAGGGELLLSKRIGAGAELGLAAGGGLLAVTCVGGSVHLPGRAAGEKVDTFINAGYAHLSALTESFGASNGWNVGAGLTYWYGTRTGVRIEFQDVLYHSVGSDQLWVLRVGFAFR